MSSHCAQKGAGRTEKNKSKLRETTSYQEDLIKNRDLVQISIIKTKRQSKKAL